MARARNVATIVLVLAIALAAGWWAGRATLHRPTGDEAGNPVVTYTVVEAHVGQTQTFTASAAWATRPLAVNSAAGTVTTTVVKPTQPVTVGDVLYSVDLRPVVAAVGSVPMFRDLTTGVTGADVTQLQAFLQARELLAADPTGRFDSATSAAVRAWQRSTSVAADGVVRAGDLVFVPSLPARVMLAPGVSVGAQIAPGTPALLLVPETPELALILSTDQSDLIPLDAGVDLEYADGTWSGVMGQATSTDDGQLKIALTAPDGGPICGDTCSAIPVGVDSRYRASVIVVPEATGPAVPATALRSDPAGATYVVMADGERRSVTVTASANGRSVVTGLDVGDVIRLFGDAMAPTGDASTPSVAPPPVASPGG